MNSGFYPTVLMPGCFRVGTQSQQPPFYFGASSVPYDLAMNQPSMHIHHSGIPGPVKGHTREHKVDPPKRQHKKTAKKKTKK
jgi:hypothetical protein